MHAMGSGVWVGLVAGAIVACGGNATKQPQVTGSGGTGAEAGAGPIAGSGGTQAGAGPDAGGQGGSDTSTGGAGAPTGGGSNGTSTTGMSTTGLAAGADGIGGDDPTGGASSDGVSSMSGTGGATLIEPPPNCESVRQSEDAESCSYEYTCDKRTHFDNCRREGDGVWACECGTFSTPKRHFEIEGVEGLEACRVIAHACESDVPVSPTTTCRYQDAVSDSGTCSAQATCGNALDLGSGIVARAVERHRSECQPKADGTLADSWFDCSCVSDSAPAENHQLIATSIDEVCAPLLEFCTTLPPLSFESEICGYTEPGGTLDWDCPTGEDCRGCMMGEECYRTAPIDPAVSMIFPGDYDVRVVFCRPEQGELQCTCEMTVDEVYGDATTPAEILDVCRESADVCSH